MTRPYGPRDVAAAAELDAMEARAVAAETKARQLEVQALAFRDRALTAEATVARVEALAVGYEADARDEGYGGESWSTTAAAIRAALAAPSVPHDDAGHVEAPTGGSGAADAADGRVWVADETTFLNARILQAAQDRLPCPRCGGDRLRADFTSSGKCHVAGEGR
jgi:hypothetical protein